MFGVETGGSLAVALPEEVVENDVVTTLDSDKSAVLDSSTLLPQEEFDRIRADRRRRHKLAKRRADGKAIGMLCLLTL